MLQTIGSLRGVIAMRLHAAVFAYCTHTPCALLAYHEKCEEWARMIALPPHQLIEANQVDPSHLATVIAQFNDVPPPLAALPLEHALERALRNWNWDGGMYDLRFRIKDLGDVR